MAVLEQELTASFPLLYHEMTSSSTLVDNPIKSRMIWIVSSFIHGKILETMLVIGNLRNPVESVLLLLAKEFR